LVSYNNTAWDHNPKDLNLYQDTVSVGTCPPEVWCHHLNAGVKEIHLAVEKSEVSCGKKNSSLELLAAS
jgi:hypothetical protein